MTWGRAFALAVCTFATCNRMTGAGHEVRTTLLVHDSQGRILSDLKESDFRVSDNGADLPISSFKKLGPSRELIRARPPEGYIVSNRPLAAFDFPQPTTVVLLDTRNTDPEFQPWMEAQCLRFFTLLRPGEDVAVFDFGQHGLKLLHQFSNSPEHLADAVAPAGLKKTGSTFRLQRDAIKPIEPETADALEQEPTAAQRYSDTCAALIQLTGYLSGFAGRKNLLWMSGDFPHGTPACNDMLRAMASTDVAIYPVDVRSEITLDPFQVVPPGDEMILPKKRRRALSGEYGSTLSTIAGVTGGKAIVNRNQLAEAMFDAAEASRTAYEIAFQVPDSNWDNRIHRMNVKTNSRDSSVLAKQAYLAGAFDFGPYMGQADMFDTHGLGISAEVTSDPERGALRARLYIASGDLEWVRTEKGWTASLESASFGVKSEERISLSVSPFTYEVDAKANGQPFKVELRDPRSKRSGTLLIPSLKGKKP